MNDLRENKESEDMKAMNFEESSKRNSCIKDEENHVEKMNVILFQTYCSWITLTTTIL